MLMAESGILGGMFFGTIIKLQQQLFGSLYMNKNELLKMDFLFISCIGDNIYEILDVKEVWERDTRVDIVGDFICFWDNSGSDHRYCLPIKNILLKNKWMK